MRTWMVILNAIDQQPANITRVILHSYSFWEYCKLGDVFIVNNLLSGSIYRGYHRDLRHIIPPSKKRKHNSTHLSMSVEVPFLAHFQHTIIEKL